MRSNNIMERLNLIRNIKEAVHKKAVCIVDSKMLLSPEVTKLSTLEETRQMLYELQVSKVELEMQNHELRRTQEELDKTKERYFELYNHAPVGYCTLSKEGIILEANSTAAMLLGVELKNLNHRLLSDFILYSDQDNFYFCRKNFFDTRSSQTCELRMVRSDGSAFWAQLSATEILDQDCVPKLALVISDISELKTMQEEIRFKDKMVMVQSRQAAMGEMISMIAHQWRQPLNVIGLSVADIETKRMLEILDNKTFDHDLAVITENIAFMSETIDSFRSFFTPDKPKELVSVEKIIDSIVGIIGKGLENNNIALTVENNSKASLYIHKNSLIQVLINLFGNAKEALLEKKVKPASIKVTIKEKKGLITTTICDNAGGIPEAMLERIGEPYFTTKGVSGTGLGIYIAKTIVEDHLFGTLKWRNSKDGACFEIAIKAAEEEGENKSTRL